MSMRQQAIGRCVDWLRDAYPDRGFLIHDGVENRSKAKNSIGLFATRDLAKDEILIVVPKGCSFASSHPTLEGSGKLGVLLRETHALLTNRRELFGLPEHAEQFSDEDVKLQLLLMVVLYSCSEEGSAAELKYLATYWRPYFDTLPSSIAESPLYWSADELDSLKGTVAGERVAYIKQEAEALFAHVIAAIPSTPFLPDSRDKRKRLHSHAMALLLSRAHDEGSLRIDSDDCASLTPLIDLVNGGPEGSAAINVGFHKGYWPFVKGRIFHNECNLPCSALSAQRQIKAGTELIVDYGAVSASGFLMKYGVVPDANPCGETFVLPPPQLLPPDTDTLRWAALQSNGYSREMLTPLEEGNTLSSPFFLRQCDVQAYRESVGGPMSAGETQNLSQLRQLAVMLVAGEDVLRSIVEHGRMRGDINIEQVGQVMKGMVDFKLGQLRTVSSSVDLAKASSAGISNNLRTGILARVAERELLAQWRHAFCRKFGLRSHADQQSAQAAGLLQWEAHMRAAMGSAYEPLPGMGERCCANCARVTGLKRCTRCKVVSYCGVSCQRTHWRAGHKALCKSNPAKK